MLIYAKIMIMTLEDVVGSHVKILIRALLSLGLLAGLVDLDIHGAKFRPDVAVSMGLCFVFLAQKLK